MKNKASVTPLV